MEQFLVFRPDDQLVLGVGWRNLSVVGADSAGLPLLEARDGSVVVVTMPPQHVAEQVSPAGSSLPPEVPSGVGDEKVPVWRAALSGPTWLVVTPRAGTRFVPTIEGILALTNRRALETSNAGADRTTIELPWRLVFSPVTSVDGHVAVASHPVLPVTASDVSGLWRTRIVAAVDNGPAPATPVDGGLGIVATDEELAGTPDPPFAIPVDRDIRRRIHAEASRDPAVVDRLELSPIGGTMTARGVWAGYLWEHDAVLGRDMRVRTAAAGVLYPFGFRAVYSELTVRELDPDAGGAAVLRSQFVLTIDEPARTAPGNARARRAFPFDEVAVETTVYPDLRRAAWQDHPIPGGEAQPTYFRPAGQDGPVLFPLRFTAGGDVVRTALPLIFVADLSPLFDSLSDSGLAAVLTSVYGTVPVPLPGVSLDLVRTATPSAGDRHEVHGLSLRGGQVDGTYWPGVETVRLALPALRTLLGDDEVRLFGYADRYLDAGPDAGIVLEGVGPGSAIDVGFAGNAERSGGLVVPKYEADALSRVHGPVSRRMPPDPTGMINPKALFAPEATLFGFPLRDLLGARVPQPRILSTPTAGGPPDVRMTWTGVPLTTHLPFEANPASTLTLTAVVSATTTETTCTLANFALVLPAGRPQLRLRFTAVTFTQTSAAPPHLTLDGVSVEFLNELQLLEELGTAVAFAGAGAAITASPTEITASYRLPLPSIAAGAFVLRNVVFGAGITVPFDGRPVAVSVGFASRREPFALTVLMFGGGGYLEIDLDHTGVRRLDAALEFGALIALDFLVAAAEVHALGGVRYLLAEDGSVTLSGYLRIGGCVDILGLVSVSLELCLAMTYRSDTRALVGRATMVIEIDLTLWSESVELDSGEWVLAGGRAPATRMTGLFTALDDGTGGGLERWRAYRAAFTGPEST